MKVQIKYVHGSLKASRERGLESDYLFYLSLKPLFSSKGGRIYYGEYLSFLSDNLSLSKTSISLKMKSLLECGMIVKMVNRKGQIIGFQLKSYDHVWKVILGIKLGDILRQLVNLRSYEFLSSTLKEKKRQLQALDLINYGKESKRSQVIRNLGQAHRHLVSSQEEGTKQELHTTSFKVPYKKMKEVLGYKSSASACNLRRDLESSQLITVKRRHKSVSLEELRLQSKQGHIFPGFKGIPILRMSNEYEFTPNNHFLFNYSQGIPLPNHLGRDVCYQNFSTLNNHGNPTTKTDPFTD